MTKRVTGLFIAASITLIIAWNSGSNLFYFISSLLFSLVFVGLVISLFLMPSIEIDRSISEWAHEDDYVDVEISLKSNHNRPTYNLLLEDRFLGLSSPDNIKSFFIDRIKRKEHLNFKYKARCSRRGIYEFPPIALSSADQLGMFSWKQTTGKKTPFTVFPKMFNIEYMPHNPTGFIPWLGLSSGRTGGEHNEFFGVREYQRGDSIKRIHWPSSAKKGELIVKQYEKTFINEATILLDMNKENNLGFEKESTCEYAIKIAASIARYFIEQGTLVQLIANSADKTYIPLGKGKTHLQKILRQLAKIQADGADTFNTAINELSTAIPSHSTAIPITVDYEYLQLWGISNLLSKNVTIIPVVLNSRTFNPNAAQQINSRSAQKEKVYELEALSHNLINIRCGENLQEKFREIAWK